MQTPVALLFDVFGTCVDWRTSVAREVAALASVWDPALPPIDWLAFADAWRSEYQPRMEPIRNGSRPWESLDRLHRGSLADIAPRFGLGALSAAQLDALAQVWHRLDPWPDVVPGLMRLKQRAIIAPNSNGNIALIVNMAKRAGLPWDVILGAEITRAYKPTPEAYLRSVEALALAPGEVMMVAAHNDDLIAAASCGLQTGFVPRPAEHGTGQRRDLTPGATYTIVATDFGDLATQLGA